MHYSQWLQEKIPFLVVFEKKHGTAVPPPVGAIAYAEPDVEITSVSESITIELSVPTRLLQKMHRMISSPLKTANDSPTKILSLYLRSVTLSTPEYEVNSVIDLLDIEETY